MNTENNKQQKLSEHPWLLNEAHGDESLLRLLVQREEIIDNLADRVIDPDLNKDLIDANREAINNYIETHPVHKH